jgi:hypothetical protein
MPFRVASTTAARRSDRSSTTWPTPSTRSESRARRCRAASLDESPPRLLSTEALEAGEVVDQIFRDAQERVHADVLNVRPADLGPEALDDPVLALRRGRIRRSSSVRTETTRPSSGCSAATTGSTTAELTPAVDELLLVLIDDLQERCEVRASVAPCPTELDRVQPDLGEATATADVFM